MSRVAKIPSRVSRYFIMKLEFINIKWYKKQYVNWLRKRGVRISGTPNYISNTAYFDGSKLDYIELGDGCTISRDVLLLTHDYSMHTVFPGVHDKLKYEDDQYLRKQDDQDCLLNQRPIHIGNNSFIGARACLLPGTTIGKNCIIGAGSVVKGSVPDNSIVFGNPAKIYTSTIEWMEKKIQEMKKEN